MGVPTDLPDEFEDMDPGVPPPGRPGVEPDDPKGGRARGGGGRGGRGGRVRGRGGGGGRGSTEPEEAPEPDGDAAEPAKKRQAKASGKAKAKGAKTKAGEGERVCRTCAIAKPLCDFVTQNNDCAGCRLPLKNLRRVAESQGAESVKWLNEYVSCPENRLKMVTQYNLRCPTHTLGAGPRGGFPILQYRKELTMEKALMKDGISEMMSEIAYQHFASKPKNGGLSPLEASAKWHEKHSATGAVTDSLGENPKYPARVAIKVKDLIVDRNARRELEGATQSDKAITSATEDDIKKAVNRLENAQFGEEGGLSSGSGALDYARQFTSATTDLADGGSASQTADVKRRLGDIKTMMQEYDQDEENREAKKQKKTQAAVAAAASGSAPDWDDAGGGGDGATAAAGGQQGQAAAEARPVWHQRDVKVADAMKNHEQWCDQQLDSIVSLIAKAKISLKAATDPEIASMCCRDADILKNRLHALRLVKGGAESVTAAVEMKSVLGGTATPIGKGCEPGQSPYSPRSNPGSPGLGPGLPQLDAAAAAAAPGDQGDEALALLPAAALEKIAIPEEDKTWAAAYLYPDPVPDDAPREIIQQWIDGLKMARAVDEFDIEAEKTMKGALEAYDTVVKERDAAAAAAATLMMTPKAKSVPRPPGTSLASTSVVTGEDADASRLRSYIAKVSTNIGNCNDGDFSIGMTAPSRQYRGLLTLSEFKSIPEEIKRCMSKAELAAVGQRWKQNKTALTELQTMVKAAETRVALTLQQARQKKQAGGAGAGGGLNQGKNTVHDMVLTLKAAAGSMAEADAPKCGNVIEIIPKIFEPNGAFDPAVPALVADIATSMELRGQCMAYMEAFPGTEEKAKNRRGQKPLTPSAQEGLDNVLRAFLHANQRVEVPPGGVKDSALKCALIPSIYVVDKKLETSAFELGQLPTFRACLAGSRSFVVVQGSAVYNYLDSLGRKYDGKAVATFLREISQKDFDGFAGQGHAIWHGRQEAGQAMYVPPGSLFWEQIGDSDFGGAKSVVLLSEKTDPESGQSVGKDSESLLSDVCKCLMQHGSANQLAISARDLLASMK